MSDDFLEGLRGAGRPDSEGRFTVDHLRASELLRRHRLIEPERWVLKAVQAAVALGAARVDVTADAARVQVWHDAPPLSRMELETVLSAALPEAADRRGTGRRHLAVALDGALAATFVLDGVNLESERNLMDRPGLLAILAARGMRTDLTEFALVHDDAFHRAIEYLRRVALWMYD